MYFMLRGIHLSTYLEAMEKIEAIIVFTLKL
ncbi:hypothetical protein AAZX31_05G016300 [Glycine max]